jgi:hypothetical protein
MIIKNRQVIFERVRNGGRNNWKRKSTTESSASEGGEGEKEEERKLNVAYVHTVYEPLPFKHKFLQ